MTTILTPTCPVRVLLDPSLSPIGHKSSSGLSDLSFVSRPSSLSVPQNVDRVAGSDDEVESVTLMSRALSGTSPSVLRRYVNGGILDPSESEEATTGLLQASATADDEDDGLTNTTTAAVIQTSTAASGGRLEASGTEVSLHGRPAPTTAPAPGGRTSSSTSIRSSWKLKYQDFLPERKHGRFAKWNPSSSEHFQ